MTERGAGPRGDETRLLLRVQRLRQELEALHETTAALADDDRTAGLVDGAEGFLFLLDEARVMRLRVAKGAADTSTRSSSSEATGSWDTSGTRACPSR